MPDAENQVRQLTKRGVMVTPGMLERIRRGEDVLGDTRQESSTRSQPKPKLSVKVRKTPSLDRMSAQDFLSYYSSRFEGLRDMLLKKLPAVSINKAPGSYSEVSVIGMVRETRPGGFLLEDATGEIEVFGAADTEPDDVVGVTGHIKEGRMFQKEIAWPDVPLTNRPGNVPGLTILLAGRMNASAMKAIAGSGLVFLADVPGKGTLEEDSHNIIHSFPNPCHATVKKGSHEMSVLIHEPARPVRPERCKELLMKRHLFPERSQIKSRTDPFIIEPVPDLFWTISDTQHVERYKGVTVIVSRKDDLVKFDAGTGRVFFAQGE